ncbi:MAG: FecR domain-containing protein [Myxococcales bacterium]|nr:FecR domain-containing protein [Myxococcales bacterium]
MTDREAEIQAARDAFRSSTDLTDGAARRIRNALLTRQLPPPVRPWFQRSGPWLLAAVCAAVLWVVLRSDEPTEATPAQTPAPISTPSVAQRPPPQPRAEGQEPRPVPSPPPVRMASSLPPSASAWDHVELAFDGEGTLAGTPKAPEVLWESGTLGVDVVPDKDVVLTVVTPEAEVRVLGTRFDVHRAAHATTVSVSKGRVSVACTGEPEVVVKRGRSLVCLPTDPSSLLLRVTQLAAEGAPTQRRLETLQHARHLVADESVVGGELLGHHAKALAEAGRADEALAIAERYLALSHQPRRAELATYVARTRYEREGCAAEPTLRRAVQEAPGAPESLLLAECVLPDDPDLARRLLQDVQSEVAAVWRQRARRVRASLEATEDEP